MGEPPRALSSPPSLWTWMTVAALVGLVAIVSVFVSLRDDEKRQERYAAAVRDQIASLDELPIPGARDAPIVVVLGHSLVWAALLRDGTAQRKIAAGVDLVVMTGELKHPHWFEALLPALRRLHPDLLVVDSELLRIEGTDLSLTDRLRHLMQKIWPPKPPVTATADCIGFPREPLSATFTKRYQEWFNPKWMSLDRLPALAALKGEGIAVDVLQMPRSGALDGAAPNLIMWRKAEAAMVEEQGIGILTPTGEWPDADYCDHTHLNLAGAAQFDTWFTERLKQAFNLAP